MNCTVIRNEYPGVFINVPLFLNSQTKQLCYIIKVQTETNTYIVKTFEVKSYFQAVTRRLEYQNAFNTKSAHIRDKNIQVAHMNQLGLHTSEWMLISTFVLTLDMCTHKQTHTHTYYCTMLNDYNEPSHF